MPLHGVGGQSILAVIARGQEEMRAAPSDASRSIFMIRRENAIAASRPSISMKRVGKFVLSAEAVGENHEPKAREHS
ncbi:hypothetical protein QN219_23010 [Sinorhizobium sp. 7-81]|uniref:hypothetical protein n=1 Tax=Sinorhizobium sp. 8-89 TaxID=3049089 RepID=UPI0024C3AFD4|nr:hypothetical protein [Sinorhizobium sp. 8-89]MDK1492895.1 hypothetical protein [Sinorhizobium sp. 8-89]